MPRSIEFDYDEALTQAMETFWKAGYTATSIQDLVERTQLLRGSIYHTFGDKHSLFEQALRRYGELAMARAAAIVAEPGSPLDHLRALFMEIVNEPRAEQERGSMLCNTITELVPHDAGVAGITGEIIAQMKALMLVELEQAKAQGLLASHHQPEALADYLVSSLQGLCVMAKTPLSREALGAIVDVTISTLR
jgi:TetR/AcrR family transcriptional regulator, transcriptional repressor for nem operon